MLAMHRESRVGWVAERSKAPVLKQGATHSARFQPVPPESRPFHISHLEAVADLESQRCNRLISGDGGNCTKAVANPVAAPAYLAEPCTGRRYRCSMMPRFVAASIKPCGTWSG